MVLGVLDSHTYDGPERGENGREEGRPTEIREGGVGPEKIYTLYTVEW